MSPQRPVRVGGEMQQLLFPDVAIAGWRAREELLAYQRRLLAVRSEVREIKSLSGERIAQSKALMVRADALIFTTCYGRKTDSIIRFVQRDVFEPAAIAIMSEAFDMAIKDLEDTGQPERVLEVMAGRIARLAGTGVFDLLRLRAAALAGL